MAVMRDATLSVYGSGAPEYEKSLHEAAARLELLPRVRFHGPVSGAEKARALQRADICVVPSHSENFGIVVAEALAHGTPVVASTGTPWSEIEARGAGRWVSNDARSLARAIESMREADLAATGRRGREWMGQEFAWDSIAVRMHASYETLTVQRTAALGRKSANG
jgi:glycosyltransferase involved in cell wall biosynthesis